MRWRKAGVYYRQCYLCRWRKQVCRRRLIKINLNRNSNLCACSARFIGFGKKISNVYRRCFEVELMEDPKTVFRNLHTHAVMFDNLLFFKMCSFSAANPIVFNNTNKASGFFSYADSNFSSFIFVNQPVPDCIFDKRL